MEFGEEEEKCGERSAEEQLLRPPLQPAAPSDEPILSLPACPEPAPTPPEPPDPASKERRTHTHTHVITGVCWEVSRERCYVRVRV